MATSINIELSITTWCDACGEELTGKSACYYNYRLENYRIEVLPCPFCLKEAAKKAVQEYKDSLEE